MNICCALLSLFNSLSSCDHSAHVNVVQVKTGTSPSNSISLYSLDEASFVSVCVCMFKHGLSFIIDQRVSCWKTRKLESWTSVCRTVDVVPGRCVHLCDTRGARTLDTHQYVTLLKVFVIIQETSAAALLSCSDSKCFTLISLMYRFSSCKL